MPLISTVVATGFERNVVFNIEFNVKNVPRAAYKPKIINILFYN